MRDKLMCQTFDSEFWNSRAANHRNLDKFIAYCRVHPGSVDAAYYSAIDQHVADIRENCDQLVRRSGA